ncbi:DUF3221 domain-containing protein [Rossellomorea vietnamensis]|uniref:DUF3221 domain-containing protein n=1 Tax=Rossellomorea vietnamensis TaxID=218284 RepID=UPI003D270D57
MTLSLTGASKDRYSESIRVSVQAEDMIKLIEDGQSLSLWYDFIRESDPPQTKALKVAIIKK